MVYVSRDVISKQSITCIRYVFGLSFVKNTDKGVSQLG